MVARWIVLALGILTLMIVGVFVMAVVRNPATVASERSSPIVELGSEPERFTGQAGPWTLMVDLSQEGATAVSVVLSIADSEGRPAGAAVRPTGSLSMLDMAMGAEELTFVSEAAGRWRGSQRLSMGGQWNLELDVEGNSFPVTFSVKFPL